MSFLWELVSIQNRVHLTVFCISWSKKRNDALLTLVHFFFLEGKAFFSSSKTKRSKIYKVADRRLVVDARTNQIENAFIFGY